MKTRYFILFICLFVLQQFAISQTLYTPKGSVFYPYPTEEISNAKKAEYLAYVQTYYSEAIVLAPATATYNCHSYAWNMTCGGPTCWVNAGPTQTSDSNISVNWTDGSYVETTANYAEKIYYYQSDHSAVASTTVPGMYESKWGPWPLMRHAPGYGPYENMNKRRYYRRNVPGSILSGPALLNKEGTTTLTLVSALGTPHYYSWSCSSNLEIVNSTATSVTVLPKSKKAGWIKINIHNKEMEFKTWFGPPELDISGELRVPNGQYARFEAVYANAASPTSFEWILNPTNGNTIYGANTAFLDVAFYNAGDYQLVVRATNAHGVGEYCVRGLTVYNTNGYSATKVYPNPATDVLNVNLQSSSDMQTFSANKTTYQIRLFSGKGTLVKQTSTSGEEIQLNVSNLPNGYYYLHIYTDNENKPEIHKVIINH